MNQKETLLDTAAFHLSHLPSQIIGDIKVEGKTVTALNGRMVITGKIVRFPKLHPSIFHCHVISKIDPFDSEHLDACVFGINKTDPDAAIRQAGEHWVRQVSGPIFSLALNREVLNAIPFGPETPDGVAGCSGFLGPIQATQLTLFNEWEFDEDRLFDMTSEIAPSGEIHLGKVTLNAAK